MIIALTQGTYDEHGNIITEPTYADGYHYDVPCLITQLI
jgi:hypothetical protein